jgi:hypothetical protein
MNGGIMGVRITGPLGIHTTMFMCNLKIGFLLLDGGRVLDNRFDEVVRYGEVGFSGRQVRLTAGNSVE